MNKYKWVKFTETDKTELTIESDNETEFRQVVTAFGGRLTETLVEKKASAPAIGAVKPVVTADMYENDHICPTHGIKMVSKISPKTNKPYWSHFEAGKGICFGKGYKS